MTRFRDLIRGPVPVDTPIETWQDLLDDSMITLGELLGGKVESIDDDNVIGDGFCTQVVIRLGTRPSLFHWQGVLGCNIIDRKAYVSVTLFPFICGRRVTPFADEDFIEIRRLPDGTWDPFGWMNDEFEEYEYYHEDLSPKEPN